MGNSSSATSDAEFGANDALARLATNPTEWRGLLQRERDTLLIDVQLAYDTLDSNSFEHTYRLLISPESPRHRGDLICFFPRHPDARKRVLHTRSFWRTASLSNELNDRLRESRGSLDSGAHVLFAVACGARVFRFHDLLGTAYIVWATRINVVTSNSVATDISEGTPLLLEMNGESALRSVTPLLASNAERNANDLRPELYPLQRSACTFIWPPDAPITLLTREADPRVCETRSIEMVDDVEAERLTRDPINHDAVNMSEESAPFAPQGDDDGGELMVCVDSLALDSSEGLASSSSSSSSYVPPLQLVPVTPRAPDNLRR